MAGLVFTSSQLALFSYLPLRLNNPEPISSLLNNIKNYLAFKNHTTYYLSPSVFLSNIVLK